MADYDPLWVEFLLSNPLDSVRSLSLPSKMKKKKIERLLRKLRFSLLIVRQKKLERKCGLYAMLILAG